MASHGTGVIPALTPLESASTFSRDSETSPAAQKRQKLQAFNKNNSNTNRPGLNHRPDNKISPSHKSHVFGQKQRKNRDYLTVDEESRNQTREKSPIPSLDLTRTGTFVKDNEESNGLNIPRIDSASMSTKQKHIIRTADGDKVKEANVFIVDGEIEDKSADTDSNTVLSDTQHNNSKSSLNNSRNDKNNKTQNDERYIPDTMDSTDNNGDNSRVEQSNEISPTISEPQAKEHARVKSQSPSKSPIPAEPILHKKSNYTSQHKKKDMATKEEDDRVEKLTSMLDDMGQKLAEAEEENQRLRQDNVDLRASLDKLNVSQQKTNSEIGLLQDEWEELTKELEASKLESQQLRQQLESYGQNENTRVKEVTEQRTALEAEVIQMRNEKQELLKAREQENQSHEVIVNNLKEDIRNKQVEYDETKEKYEQQLRELKELIARLKEEILQLKTEIDSMRKENDLLRKNVVAFEKQIADLTAQINVLTDQCEKYQQTIKSFESERDNLMEYKTELERTEKKLQAALKENINLKNLVKDKDALFEKMKEDMKSLNELDHSITSLQQENDKYAKQINNLTEENVNLRSQLNPNEEQMNEIKRNNVELSERVATGKVAVSSMTELLKEKQAHIETLQKEVKTLSETNSNYLIAMDSFSTSKKQSDEVSKSKYNDIESAHKKILDENKRLRTVLAHKNMAETSHEADTDDLRKTLDDKDRELELAHERIAHLEAMLEDVYKANEIKLMQNDNNNYVNEEEAKMSVTSLPDIRYADSRGPSNAGSYAKNYTREKIQDTNRWASMATGRYSDLRQYRHAESYAKRYEHRPKKGGKK